MFIQCLLGFSFSLSQVVWFVWFTFKANILCAGWVLGLCDWNCPNEDKLIKLLLRYFLTGIPQIKVKLIVYTQKLSQSLVWWKSVMDLNTLFLSTYCMCNKTDINTLKFSCSYHWVHVQRQTSVLCSAVDSHFTTGVISKGHCNKKSRLTLNLMNRIIQHTVWKQVCVFY